MKFDFVNKLSKGKILLGSLISIGLFSIFMVGGTYAFMTNKSNTNIAITSGKVEVSANVVLTSAASLGKTKTGDTTSEHITFSDSTFDGDYSWHEATAITTATGDGYQWENGGTTIVNATTGYLSMTSISAGDKVSGYLHLTNTSSISCLYRVGYSFVSSGTDEEKEQAKLFASKLTITYGDNAEEGNFNNVIDYKSAWSLIPLSESPTEVSIPFTIGIDIQLVNQFQAQGAQIIFFVEAVQGNMSVDMETDYKGYYPAR